jgi:hypothetical protein
MSAMKTRLFAGSRGRTEPLPSIREISNRQYTNPEGNTLLILHPPIKRPMAKRRVIALSHDYSDRNGSDYVKKKMHFFNNFFLFFSMFYI